MLHCKFCQMPELLQGLLLVAERPNNRFRINSKMKSSFSHSSIPAVLAIAILIGGQPSEIRAFLGVYPGVGVRSALR